MEIKQKDERLEYILQLIKESEKPLSGTALGKKTGVSRQVIVQDIALLRMQGYSIISTARGYLIQDTKKAVRLFKVCHDTDQIQEELELIIDLGGMVEDVIVNHKAYGKMKADMLIKNRRDIAILLDKLKTGKSTPLSQITSGYHYHHISADSMEILDEIETALRNKNLLAPFLPYEVDEVDAI